jgi:atypical dual specificity phosphatase
MLTCSRIQANLWVGPAPHRNQDFKHLQSLKITAILSLQDEEERGHDGIERERAEAVRAGLAFENISVKDFDNDDLQLRLPECVAALARLVRQGHTVYVHCNAGISRSPTVIAANLHGCSKWRLERAIAHVMRCRRCLPLEDAIRNSRWLGSTEV